MCKSYASDYEHVEDSDTFRIDLEGDWSNDVPTNYRVVNNDIDSSELVSLDDMEFVDGDDISDMDLDDGSDYNNDDDDDDDEDEDEDEDDDEDDEEEGEDEDYDEDIEDDEDVDDADNEEDEDVDDNDADSKDDDIVNDLDEMFNKNIDILYMNHLMETTIDDSVSLVDINYINRYIGTNNTTIRITNVATLNLQNIPPPENETSNIGEEDKNCDEQDEDTSFTAADIASGIIREVIDATDYMYSECSSKSKENPPIVITEPVDFSVLPSRSNENVSDSESVIEIVNPQCNLSDREIVNHLMPFAVPGLIKISVLSFNLMPTNVKPRNNDHYFEYTPVHHLYVLKSDTFNCLKARIDCAQVGNLFVDVTPRTGSMRLPMSFRINDCDDPNKPNTSLFVSNTINNSSHCSINRFTNWLSLKKYNSFGCKKCCQMSSINCSPTLSLNGGEKKIHRFHVVLRNDLQDNNEVGYMLKRKAQDTVSHTAKRCKVINCSTRYACRRDYPTSHQWAYMDPEILSKEIYYVSDPNLIHLGFDETSLITDFVDDDSNNYDESQREIYSRIESMIEGTIRNVSESPTIPDDESMDELDGQNTDQQDYQKMDDHYGQNTDKQDEENIDERDVQNLDVHDMDKNRVVIIDENHIIPKAKYVAENLNNIPKICSIESVRGDVHNINDVITKSCIKKEDSSTEHESILSECDRMILSHSIRIMNTFSIVRHENTKDEGPFL